MDDYLNNRQKEVLLRLLANPADTGASYLSNLQELVKTHPQSGLFRALYGRALNEATPLVAGGYFDSRALHKLLYHYDNIPSISNDQVVMQPNGKLFGDADTFVQVKTAPVEVADTNKLTDQLMGFPDVLNVTPPEAVKEEVQEMPFAEPVNVPVEETLPDTVVDEQPQPVEEESQPFAPAPWEIAETPAKPAPVVDEEPLGRAPWELDDDEEEVQTPAPVIAEIVVEQPAHQEELEDNGHLLNDDLAAKLAYWSSIEDEYDAPGIQIPAEQNDPVEATPEPVYTEPEPTHTTHFYAEPYQHEETAINEEVYSEITSIDEINIAQLNAEPPVAEEPVTEAGQPAKHDEADRLILGNIAATDYFVFDKAFGDNKNAEPAPTSISEPAPKPMFREHTQPTTPAVQTQHHPAAEPAHHDVSKYHDEKMPYTFMWWLDKTRKEHGTLYQPYAQAPVNRPQAPQQPAKGGKQDELQQQYFENIFHLSSVDELVPDAAQTIEFDMQSKEDRLIQRFITEDPHIHPPVGEKLDTENKAKKSSEDQYEMVTETLARIYADQMLFPKAIATYKKLMLKFPEKSRYFASRIENLEKRTN